MYIGSLIQHVLHNWLRIMLSGAVPDNRDDQLRRHSLATLAADGPVSRPVAETIKQQDLAAAIFGHEVSTLHAGQRARAWLRYVICALGVLTTHL